jgi:hypothetical protein
MGKAGLFAAGLAGLIGLAAWVSPGARAADAQAAVSQAAESWTTIDCAASGIAVAGAQPGAICRKGPAVQVSHLSCYAQQTDMTGATAQGGFYAYALRISGQRCFIDPFTASKLLEVLKAHNGAEASDWGPLVKTDSGFSVEFKRGAESCFGWAKDGPPIYLGHENELIAQFCAKAGFDEAARNALTGSVKVGR